MPRHLNRRPAQDELSKLHKNWTCSSFLSSSRTVWFFLLVHFSHHCNLVSSFRKRGMLWLPPGTLLDHRVKSMLTRWTLTSMFTPLPLALCLLSKWRLVLYTLCLTRVCLDLGRLVEVRPHNITGTSLMKRAVAAKFSFLRLDQKSSKYFCKHPKIKLCRQRYLPCKSETLQAFNTCRRVQACPQREHALSISEFPHRHKLSGVSVVFVIAWREKRSSPSLIPNISRRQVRSECITNTCRRVQVCPQTEHALSISEFDPPPSQVIWSRIYICVHGELFTGCAERFVVIISQEYCASEQCLVTQRTCEDCDRMLFNIEGLARVGEK